MERKLTKHEVKSIRLMLGFTQKEMSDLLGVSFSHIARTEKESEKKYSYDVSEKLDQLVKQKIKELGLNLEELLAIIHKGGRY